MSDRGIAGALCGEWLALWIVRRVSGFRWHGAPVDLPGLGPEWVGSFGFRRRIGYPGKVDFAVYPRAAWQSEIARRPGETRAGGQDQGHLRSLRALDARHRDGGCRVARQVSGWVPNRVLKSRAVNPLPSLKAKRLLAVLERAPLSYRVVRQSGSHRRMESPGYPALTLPFMTERRSPPGSSARSSSGTLALLRTRIGSYSELRRTDGNRARHLPQ